jgi:UPF0716 protein FxsA
MHLGKRIALGLLLLPFAEVAGFLLVAWAVGFVAALTLMVLTSLAGALVLRGTGRGTLAQASAALRAGPSDGTRVSSDVGRAIAGILLVLPGFVTDLMGAALLVGPIRRRLGTALRRGPGRPRSAEGPGVIDLAPDEWRRIADKKPRRPKRR